MAGESTKKIEVLLVDDDAFFLKFITHFFARKGYEVSTASNGEEALEYARSYQPDIIVLDVDMPAPDGIETCKILKADEATRQIPVIILTATESVELNQKAFTAGAEGTVLKTMSQERLLNLVDVAVSTKKVAVPSESSQA